ncbi:peptidylprolyl isomerase [Pyrofollis japonicus]|uniref:FKBP-type peptidyl-prolyl cis-trans isomerase n=1 Tax=Pyrofollis japonicus TaxID=3060460 RepID=UPI00295A9F05|nr:peptidylprolyl isomerase [Pyrofollis japonicus]BEP18061.1 peptidylprolyl isomerase [Pyrofollis japonicus]
MALKDGDFVLVEYSLRVKETGKLIDTTSEEEARKEGIYDPRERYGPRLVIVGEGRLLPGLEKALKELDEGAEKTLEIQPEDAFGKRDPSKIKILPRNTFIKSGVVPEPGKIVEINGQLAVIRSITGGRVVVDFNHPLAGRVIEAKIKVVKILKAPDEKLLHLLLRRLPPTIKDEDIKVDYNPDEKKARVYMDEKALGIQDLQAAKRIVVLEAAKYLKDDIKEIEFVEKVRLEREEKKETEAKEEQSGTKEQEEKQQTGEKAEQQA